MGIIPICQVKRLAFLMRAYPKGSRRPSGTIEYRGQRY